jgi:hypothetical protein
MKFKIRSTHKFQFYELNNNELWADWCKNQSASFQTIMQMEDNLQNIQEESDENIGDL